jgi:hypothetical protein
MTRPRLALVFRTATAIFISVAVYITVAAIVAIVVYYIYAFVMGFRAELLTVIANIGGGIIGIHAAQSASDRVIGDYSSKSVCVAFCSIAFIGLATDAFVLWSLWTDVDFRATADFGWWEVSIDGVRYLTAIVASIAVFWKDKRTAQLIA